jgi:hypothetical protein
MRYEIGPDPNLDTVGSTLKLKKKREVKQLLGNEVFEDDEPDDDEFDQIGNQANDKVVITFPSSVLTFMAQFIKQSNNNAYYVEFATVRRRFILDSNRRLRGCLQSLVHRQRCNHREDGNH